MSNFKIALTAIFGASIIIGLIIFATSKASSTQQANLLVWGTMDEQAFSVAYKASSISSNKQITVKYVKKDTANFEGDFVEALAEGNGPDVVIMPDDAVYNDRNKLFTIPYKSFSQRDFKDRFIEAGEVFLATDGVVALPFTIDPMVMYWNRDMFSNNLIAQPPQYWDEFNGLITKMTRRDNGATITQTPLAFGEWQNVSHAKEIVALLLMQAGTPISARDANGAHSVLNVQFDNPVLPSQAAVSFYTQFSNPTSPTYTWNRSLPLSLNMFLSGSLATYMGFSSELFSIQQKNPNLNFDVTYIPQIRKAEKQITFGRMQALALVKQSKQIAAGFTLINALTEPAALKALETITSLPPVRRDLLADKPSDAYRSVFYNAALLSHSWIDPDSVRSTAVFRDMIESITSGRARVGESIGKADEALSALFTK